MQVPVDQVICGDNASLALMHDTLVFSLLHGTVDSPKPWAKEDVVKFICPVPGYDRHFALCEEYGIEMLPVELNDDGPDMDAVRALVADPAVKGMWLVPTYGNPSGSVVSEAIAAELAAMETAAPDFRIMWDNAYAVHHLTEQQTKTADILGLCAASGHPNRPMIYRVDVQDHVRRFGHSVHGRLGGQHRVVPQAPRQAHDRTRQGQPAAPRCGSSRMSTACTR